jgi:hypothetical protein
MASEESPKSSTNDSKGVFKKRSSASIRIPSAKGVLEKLF